MLIIFIIGSLIDSFPETLKKFPFPISDILIKNFSEYEQTCQILIEEHLALPAYEQCVKASHAFNLLDARGVIGVNERANYIARVRSMVKLCAELYIKGLG